MPYIGNTIRAADDYRLIDDISSGFNGSETSFALQVAGSAPVPFPKSPQQVLISVNGVIQEPDPTGSSGFNLVGTNIVFSSAPTNGHAFFGIIYATADYLNAGGNFPAGSLGAPSITFIGDENTGLFRKSGGSVGFVSDATEIANFDSNGITISSGNIIIPDSIIHNGDTNTKIRFPAADTVSVETAGSERLRITSAGLVLVGHDADKSGGDTNALLQLFTPTAAKLLLGRSDTSISSGNFLGIIDFHGTDGTSSQRGARIGAVASGDHGTDDKPTDLVFQTTADGAGSSTERMRIDSSGNVGINQNTPTCQLQVDTGSSGSGTSTALELNHKGNDLNDAIKLNFARAGGDIGSIVLEKVNNNNTTDFIFNTRASNTVSESMRITGAGNVGIGTTSPTNKLTLFGTGAGEATLQIEGEGGADPYINFLANNTQHWSAGIDDSDNDSFKIAKHSALGTNDYFVVTTAGNVGIGTASPAYNLDISNSSGEGQLRIDSSAGNHGMIRFSQGGTNKSYIQHVNGNDLAFGPGGSEKVRIDSSGNVGIGTTSPSSLLTLNHATNPSIRFEDSGTKVVQINAEGSSTNFGSFEGKALVFATSTGSAFSERMRIDTAGRLLIGHSISQTIGGNSHPLVQLNVNSNQQVLTLARFENSSAGPGMVLGKSRASSAGNYTVVQNGDSLGTITFSGADGTDLISRGAAIEAQVDGTPGSNDMPGRLVFMTSADGSDSPTERMRILSTGFLYYGATGEGPHGGFYNIDASGGASASNALNVKGTTTNYVMVSSSGRSSGNHVFFNNYNGGNTNTGTIQDNGSNISYNTSSDYRIKENIVAISDGLTRVKQLNPVRHTFKNNSAVGTVDGWLAHELDTICPYAVNGEKDAVNEDGSIKLQGVDYGRITPLLTAALKEAITKIETLETKVAALEAA